MHVTKFITMLLKGVYPYEYINEWERSEVEYVMAFIEMPKLKTNT